MPTPTSTFSGDVSESARFFSQNMGSLGPAWICSNMVAGISVLSYQYDFRLCSVFGVQVRGLFLWCWVTGGKVSSNWSPEAINGRRGRDRKTIWTHRADPVETESGPVHDAIPNHTLVQQIARRYTRDAKPRAFGTGKFWANRRSIAGLHRPSIRNAGRRTRCHAG